MRIHVFADESRTDRSRYTLIGGLWIPWRHESDLRERIHNWRRSRNMHSEMKFKNVSLGKYPEYEEFVDFFFDHPQMHFHCLVRDARIMDYRTYADGDAELAFYKFYFLLLSRRIMRGHDYHVHVDERSNRQKERLLELKNCINNWCAKEQIGMFPVRSLEPRDSKKDDLIQLADVILGAVGRRCNALTGSRAKDALTDHIEKKVGRSLDRGTSGGTRPFNVWQWQPRAKKKTP